ncbi:transposase family protein [Streptomyces sp. NPDC058293]|uniref:transposase family protein n=1 Tax=Streptomyces sp. NPDC058293 TaxID=3346429 RepID=UPI0036E2B35D
MTHVVLDGTLIESDRLAGVRENDNDLWFSQKHKALGGNVQFLVAPDGTPLWVSDVEPGSPPDITAARIHALLALYKAAAHRLPALTDKGYIGAGIGIRIPVRRPASTNGNSPRTRMCNRLLRHVRALGERTADELKQRWRTAAHHAQPQPDRRHRPSSPRFQRNLEVIIAEKTALGTQTRPVVRECAPGEEPRLVINTGAGVLAAFEDRCPIHNAGH